MPPVRLKVPHPLILSIECGGEEHLQEVSERCGKLALWLDLSWRQEARPKGALLG